MNDHKISIKNIIKANWLPANTSGVTPSISTGWYDRKSASPQVTVTDPVMTPESGGNTGYFGITTNGAPKQYWNCTVNVNFWVTREALAAISLNPKQCIFEMRSEVERIIKANYNSISDLDFISWLGGFEEVDAKNPPTVYRFVGEVGYGYMS